MADFDVQVLGPTVEPWLDPATIEHPSRLNPTQAQVHQRYKLVRGKLITLLASVDGVAGPHDDDLDGRLFEATAVEYPGLQPYPFHPANRSSRQSFWPESPGHYFVWIARVGGGGVGVHFDVENP